MLVHQLKDGRQLAYECYGDPKGMPVIFSHGLSDSRLLRHYDDNLTATLGVRIISVDQPGVGGSSPVKHLKTDRTLQNYAKDIEELVDALNIQTFAVAGHSGGAPHALALANYFGPKRVTKGILAAPAPPLDGTAPGVKELFPFLMKALVFLSKWFPWLINLICNVTTFWANGFMEHYIKEVAKSDGNPKTLLGNFKQTQIFRQSFQAGFEQGSVGIKGMMQVALINQSWGFDIQTDISQQIDVFVGDLDPMTTPGMCQKFCNALPKSTFHLWSNGGHYCFVEQHNWIQFWSALKEPKDDKQQR